MVRFIANKFVGKSKEVAENTDEKFLKSSIQAVARHILERPQNDDEWSDRGPYTSVSGTGLALALNRDVLQEVLHRSVNKEIQDIFNYCLQNLSKNRERQARYLCGDLGTLVASLNVSVRDDVIERIEQISHILAEKSYPNDEVLYGRAGYLAGVFWIRRTVNENLISDDCVKRILKAMYESGRKYSKKHNSHCPLFYEWHESEYIGAAHGLAGIYHTMMSFENLLAPSELGDLRASIDWLLTVQITEGNWPSSSKWFGREREDQLIHWCHGASGVIHLYIQMYHKTRDEKYLEACKLAGHLIWEKGILKKGPGLCHGVSGNGYAFLILYRLTSDEKWLSRALCFARLMMDKDVQGQQRTPDSPYSLFEGWAGALCFLCDLLPERRDKAQFPLYPNTF
ncbi:hypothetical protein WR25_22515 [Diploscapter pachys]|uniref:Uncharacterized protein n=1 Tax=Diploscapter pachys TaxID=2018661 RepID=A0A2A2JXR4_9BILA|nr:hypothetical protein WR25_22515 [Diploscapter pachys]